MPLFLITVLVAMAIRAMANINDLSACLEFTKKEEGPPLDKRPERHRSLKVQATIPIDKPRRGFPGG